MIGVAGASGAARAAGRRQPYLKAESIARDTIVIYTSDQGFRSAVPRLCRYEGARLYGAVEIDL